jgi:hypothetical protein
MPTLPSVGSEKERSGISIPPSRELLLFFLISCLLLIPCFWHRHIEAGDLGSHVYNAWLAQLIEQGKAPGLYIVRQWNNVLFDLLLVNLAKMFGLVAAEKLTTSLCVLVFFWGVFLLMKAVSSQPPWFLTPLIAMLSYGLIFHLGFMNCYLSIGLACIGLSLLWEGHRSAVLAAGLLAPVVLLAHPMGFLLFLSVGAYRLLWRSSPRWNWILPIAAISACFAAYWYLYSLHLSVDQAQWRDEAWWQMTGLEQFHVFGEQYVIITRAVLLIVVVTTLLSLLRAKDLWSFWRERRVPLELYLVSFVAVVLMPENLHFDESAGWIGEIGTRLTLVVAIFGLCWLASLPARRWHFAAYAVVALVFFTFIYRDTAFLNRMEASAEAVTRPLPFGTRALATIHLPPDYSVPFVHIADRACIGHCFLFSNYEASTRQFRIRVQPGSPVVTTSVDDSDDMQSGLYDVQNEDLPLKQIYQCDGRDLALICIRDLAADEKNGRIGYNPLPTPPSAPDNSDAEPRQP